MFQYSNTCRAYTHPHSACRDTSQRHFSLSGGCSPPSACQLLPPLSVEAEDLLVTMTAVHQPRDTEVRAMLAPNVAPAPQLPSLTYQPHLILHKRCPHIPFPLSPQPAVPHLTSTSSSESIRIKIPIYCAAEGSLLCNERQKYLVHIAA